MIFQAHFIIQIFFQKMRIPIFAICMLLWSTSHNKNMNFIKLHKNKKILTNDLREENKL